jgi:hypothetical protein
MKTATQYQTPTVHAFWAAGLDGRGQIVGMGDSGVDMRSCFFSDPAVPFAVPQGSAEWSAPNHRKVVYYWGLADAGMRDLVGHGTHTAGSVAGFNPRAPDSKATGGAKGARLAIADLSRTAGGDVNAPQDLEANYFPKLAAAGACVFSGVCVCVGGGGRWVWVCVVRGRGVAGRCAHNSCRTAPPGPRRAGVALATP